MFKHPVIKITAMGIAVLLLDGYLHSATTELPGPQTPKSLKVTIRSAELATAYITPGYNIFDEPTTYDVISTTGQTNLPFGSGILKKADYKIIRMLMDKIGTYSGVDPCTNLDATEADIIMPRTKLIYESPVAGTDPGKDSIVIPPFSVGSNPVELRLVFPVTKSAICASSKEPVRTLSGVGSFLAGPRGIYVDVARVRILVTNQEDHSVRAYYVTGATGSENIPVWTIQRPTDPAEIDRTNLSKPSAVFSDTTNSEIIVANRGNNSITVYRWDDITDPQKTTNNTDYFRIINGAASELSEPAGVFVDTKNNEIVVANSGNNSITVYDRTSNGQVSPKYTIKGGFTRLSGPNAVVVDSTVFDSGTSVDAVNTNSTLQDPSKNFIPNQYQSNFVEITAGTGARQIRPIVSNTSNVLTVDPPWSIVPDGSSSYKIIYYSLYVANSSNNSVTIYNRTVFDPSVQPVPVPVRQIYGSNSRLNGPVGLSVSNILNEVIVTNGLNNTLTFYNLEDIRKQYDPATGIANIYPVYTIRGDDTKLSNPENISLIFWEILSGVSTGGNSSTTLWDTTRFQSGSLKGFRVLIVDGTGKGQARLILNNTGDYLQVSPPWVAPIPDNTSTYIILLPTIFAANSGEDKITVHDMTDRKVQLENPPMLVNSATQQLLYPRYFYKGVIKSLAGDSNNSLEFDGYHFVWQITDDRLRQEGDVSNDAVLVPPSDMVFTLMDGTQWSTLPLGCKKFVPFIQLRLNTNCNGTKIKSPYPVPGGSYEIPATVLGKYSANKITYIETPKNEAEFPRPVPTLMKTYKNGKHSIDSISWVYYDKANTNLDSDPSVDPMMNYSQQIIVFLNKNYNEVTPCHYKLVQGQGANIAYNSGELSPEIRFLSGVKNNGCDIVTEDVESIQFIVKDALENNFVYDWAP